MIISASRRTDIAAFYSQWFMNRIRAGSVQVRNPFNARQIKEVSLKPDDVDVIVFWTRNPAKMMKHLDELDDNGFRYYFQFTITGFPRLIEKSVPSMEKAVEMFGALSERLSPERVIWRFDPILLNTLVDENEHLKLFQDIAEQLEGFTKRVVISFADYYGKVSRNLNRLTHPIDGNKIKFSDITQDQQTLEPFVTDLVQVAQQHKLEIQSCAEDIDLAHLGIPDGKCIDDSLINQTFGLNLDVKKDKGQRKSCGCIQSIDIGQYNTCLHGCSYCYATYSSTWAQKNWNKHDENSPLLISN
jgi:DNA repair photolyase